jgi:hypothetical protein
MLNNSSISRGDEIRFRSVAAGPTEGFDHGTADSESSRCGTRFSLAGRSAGGLSGGSGGSGGGSMSCEAILSGEGISIACPAVLETVNQVHAMAMTLMAVEFQIARIDLCHDHLQPMIFMSKSPR